MSKSCHMPQWRPTMRLRTLDKPDARRTGGVNSISQFSSTLIKPLKEISARARKKFFTMFALFILHSLYIGCNSQMGRSIPRQRPKLLTQSYVSKMAPCMQWALPMREDLFLLSRFAPRKNSSIPIRDFTLVLIVATIQATLQQLRIVRRFEKDRYHYHQRTSEANVHALRVSPFLTRNGASAISVRFIHGGRKPQRCDLWHNYEVGELGPRGSGYMIRLYHIGYH